MNFLHIYLTHLLWKPSLGPSLQSTLNSNLPWNHLSQLRCGPTLPVAPSLFPMGQLSANHWASRTLFSHLGNKNNISSLTSLDHCDLGGKGINCARTLHKQNETGLITRLLFRKTEKHHGSEGDIFNITVIVITECVTFKSCWPRVWELVLHFDGAL